MPPETTLYCAHEYTQANARFAETIETDNAALKAYIAEIDDKRSRGEPTPPEIKRAYERLRRWRSAAAEERGVEPFVVARNELLSKIAHARCENGGDLEKVVPPFTYAEYGKAILAVLHGNAQNAG